MVEVPRWGTVIVSALLMISPGLRTRRTADRQERGRPGGHGLRARDRSRPEPCYGVRRFLCRQGHAEKPGALRALDVELLLFMRTGARDVGTSRRCRRCCFP